MWSPRGGRQFSPCAAFRETTRGPERTALGASCSTRCCSAAVRSCPYLSHHTLPLMSTLPWAVLAAVRFALFSELSIAGYGRRVGTKFVTAFGPGFSTG